MRSLFNKIGENMNKNDLSIVQLRVIWIAIGIVVLSFVCPPWKNLSWNYSSKGVDMSSTSGPSYPGGYALIFLPPAGAAGIDIERVILQTAVIAILATGIVVTLARRKSNP